jgi:hypothetical protein
MTDAVWYYAQHDEVLGPLGFEELVQTLKQHPKAKEVLVWCEGQADWTRSGEVPELNQRLALPPPLPDKRKGFVSPLSGEYSRASLPENQKSNWMGWVASVGGGLIGLGLSKALGGSFWIPALCILLAHWALTKTKAPAPIVLMLSVLVGHTLWMGIGHISLILLDKQSPDLALFAVDVLAVLILTVWSLKRPSVIACLMVLVYQGVSAATVILEFEQISRVSAVAAFMHCALRALGICLAIYAAVKIRPTHELDGVGG